MSLEKLKGRIKKGEFCGLYLFFGEEEYLLNYYLKAIEERTIEPNYKDFNYSVIYGKNNISSIISACDTAPMMSDKRMIVVKDSEIFHLSNSAKKHTKDNESDLMLEYFKKMPKDIILVFVERQIDKRTIMFKTLNENGLFVQFEYQKPGELIKWVTKVISSFGASIKSEDAEYLLSMCNPAMQDILNEAKKLADFAGDKGVITRESIDDLCVKSIQNRIFEMVDSISQSSQDKAYRMLSEMILLKEPLPKIGALVARHFRILYYIKRMVSNGVSKDKISQVIGIAPYFMLKYEKQAEKYSIQKLREAVKECLEIDKKVKIGLIDQRIGLELIISKYSA